MEVIDLVGMLSKFGGKLEKVTVYGYVACRLSRPSNLQDSCKAEDGIFAKMVVIAVDLSYYSSFLKQNGITDTVFLVNGDIALFIDNNGRKLPDFYETRGTLRFGAKTGGAYISMFNYRKNGNSWYLVPNALDDIAIGYDSLGPLVTEVFKNCYTTGNIVMPDMVALLPRFYAVPTYITPSQQYSQNNGQAQQQAQQGNLQAQQGNLQAQQGNLQAKQSYPMPDLSRAMNGVSLPTVPVNTFVEQSRSTILPKSKQFDKLVELEKDSYESRKKFVENLKTTFKLGEDTNYVLELIRNIKGHMTRKPSNASYTGRAILKLCLSDFKESKKSYLGSTCGEYLVSIFDEIYEYMLNGRRVDADGEAWKLCLLCFGDNEEFYARVLEKLTGISLVDIQHICAENDISFSKLVNENPYALQMIGGVSFEDVELLGVCFNKFGKPSLERMRNIAIVNSFVNDRSKGDTYFNVNELPKQGIGIRLSDSKYKKCKVHGSFLSDSLRDNFRYFIGQSEQVCYSVDGFVKDRSNWVQKLAINQLRVAVKDYTSVGLGVMFGDYLTSSLLLKKELFIYNFMYELGSQETDFTKEEIDSYIKDYEQNVGFELNAEQRSGVYLLMHRAGLVTGCAGSGKTTTSDCFVYCLERHFNTDVNVRFATPTGKAAKRLQEVVKKPVKTMCSMFKTWASDDNLFDTERNDEIGSQDYFIFDEMAMVTVDLLYAVLNKINDSCIYMFGDIHQLPPIGKGLPFKNLLRFMPCAFLKVSKRAADDSFITLNSDYINNYSDYNNWKELVSGKDFKMLPCNTEDIKSVCVELCKHFLGQGDARTQQVLQGYPTIPVIPNLKPSDIQVVSPVGTPRYDWGCAKLNSALQPIFNKNKGYNKTVCLRTSESNYNKFVLGDRVLHGKTNMYGMQWYTSDDNQEFQKIYGFGVSNGDVGEIVDFVPADNCTFLKEVECEPDDFEYPKSLRDDSSWVGKPDAWFIVVKYYDYMSDRDYLILYRCQEVVDSNITIGKEFYGEDIQKLELFYAGTVHKLQGSQYKVIISPLGNDLYAPGFLSKNLMYTAYTRGISMVCAVGSIANNKNSALSKARQVVAEEGVLTIGEYLTL